MLKYWKKGAGEIIGFAVGLCIFLYILTFFFSMSIIQNAHIDMDYAVMSASRAVVVCADMDEAKQTAEEIVHNALQHNNTLQDVQVDIRYTPGSEQDWKKGSFVDVTVIARVYTPNPLIDDTRHVKETVMIEHA